MIWIGCLALLTEVLGKAPFDREIEVDERMVVERRVIDVRVIDRKGNLIKDLTLADFRLTHGGKEIPILSCEWVDEDALEAEIPQGATNQELTPSPGGRLIVLFFQVDLSGDRLRGLRGRVAQAAGVLHRLDPRDYVAVMSFDSHLKLWSDFSLSRESAARAVARALLRTQRPDPRPAAAPSLVSAMDMKRARRAANAEQAVQVIGDSLKPFAGSKILYYLGWGLADYWRGNVRLRVDYPKAVQALNDSRTTVMSLDLSRWDYSALHLGMRHFAEDTGGYFLKTPRFVTQAMNKMGNSIGGFYIISHEAPDPRPREERYRLRLVNKSGKVLVKSPYR